MIPPCRFYKPYYGPQLRPDRRKRHPDSHIRHQKIKYWHRSTLHHQMDFQSSRCHSAYHRHRFYAPVGLGVDVVNNTFILPRNSVYRRHHLPRTQSHYIPCISGPNANDAFDSPSTSPRLPDITDKFPLKRYTALERTNANAANAVAHFINDLPKNAVDSPIVNDEEVSSVLQEPEDPPIKRILQSSSLASEQPFDLLKADFLKHKVLARHNSNFAHTFRPKTITAGVLHSIITTGPPVKTHVHRLFPEQFSFVKKEIGALLEAGILIPSSSSFAGAIHIVPKKQPGQFQMVGDYRALNNITQLDRYPLPLISDAMDSLKG